MADEQKYTRRGFLKRFAVGMVAGGAAGGATYEKPPPARYVPGRPGPADWDKVLPPMLNTRTQVGRVVAGAVVGGTVVNAAHRMATSNAPPADTGRRQREIGRAFHEGREHEQWNSDDGVNPNEDHRLPPHR